MAKLERRLGGDPRKLIPPKGLARRTFDRLAVRHAAYRAKVVAHRQCKLERRMRKQRLPTDAAGWRALRETHGLGERQT